MEITTKSRVEEGGYYRWAEPNSEITVCLKTETVDRLQTDALSVVGSSLRAGKEVGGILLGRIDVNETSTMIFVDDFVPFPCAHGNGLFYELTAADAAGFEATLAWGRTQWEQSVVGYYRSHNRDGLFLSPCDLELIQHHFRGPDNLFLIIKTLPNRTCTAGFFFWKDGHIQSEFTDSEAPLIPVSIPSAVQVAPPREAIAQVRDEQLVGAATEFTGRWTLRHRLIYGVLISSVAAVAMVAAIRHRTHRPVVSRVGPEIRQVAKGTVPAPAPILPSPVPPVPEAATAAAITPERPSPFRRPPAMEGSAPATSVRTQSAYSRGFASRSRGARRSFVMPPPLAPNTTGRALSPTPLAPSGIEPFAPDAGPLLLSDETTCCIATASYEPSRPNRLKRLIREVPGFRKLNPSGADKGFVPARPLHEIQISLPPDGSSRLMQNKQMDLKASVDVSGRVTRVELLSPRDEYLVKLAAYNATRWQFAPAKSNDRPVSSEVILHFRFDTNLSHQH